MVDHVRDKHPDLAQNLEALDPSTEFTFSVLSSHRDPLTRQTTEAVRIQQALETGLHSGPRGEVQIKTLNRKGEHFSARERWVSRD